MTIITGEPIDITKWVEECKSPETGAMELFIGLTRNAPSDNGISSLYYEAYEEMVQQEGSIVENTIKTRYPGVKHLLIIHRTGNVPVSEPSMLVILTGEHRTGLFQAMEECVDLIKRKLPVWKKGVYTDGRELWLTNRY